MFQPKGIQVWNPYLPWQPVPVHTVPAKYDNLLAEPLPACPAYEHATKDLLNSPRFLEINKKSQPLYHYLTENTGYPVNSLASAFSVRDTIFVESTHHKV